MSELKTKWPRTLPLDANYHRLWDYERALAEAALERLRVAVEALERINKRYGMVIARDALAAIGPIPESRRE